MLYVGLHTLLKVQSCGLCEIQKKECSIVSGGQGTSLTWGSKWGSPSLFTGGVCGLQWRKILCPELIFLKILLLLMEFKPACSFIYSIQNGEVNSYLGKYCIGYYSSRALNYDCPWMLIGEASLYWWLCNRFKYISYPGRTTEVCNHQPPKHIILPYWPGRVGLAVAVEIPIHSFDISIIQLMPERFACHWWVWCDDSLWYFH